MRITSNRALPQDRITITLAMTCTQNAREMQICANKDARCNRIVIVGRSRRTHRVVAGDRVELVGTRGMDVSKA